MRAYDPRRWILYNTVVRSPANEGIYQKAYGGINNAIPYIDDFSQNGYVDDWLPGHKHWMLEYYRLPIPVPAMKGYLYQIPDGAAIN